MPWHVAIDSASERHLGRLQIGTTRRGIGPAYADKAARIGIRVQDILDPKILRQKFETALAEKNVVLERVHGVEPLELGGARRADGGATPAACGRYVADTSLLVDRALRDGERVLLEGAQGTLLDLDHGTYPFVTSSSPIAGAADDRGRHRPDADRPRPRRRQGLRHPGRRGPLPHRDRGPRAGARAGARRRVRDDDRPRAPLRLARPRRAPLRRAGQRDDEPRADEDRRPLRVRGAPGLRRATACPTASETEEFPAHQSDFHHARAGLRDARRLAGAARRGRVAGRPAAGRPRLRRLRRGAARHRGLPHLGRRRARARRRAARPRRAWPDERPCAAPTSSRSRSRTRRSGPTATASRSRAWAR